MSEAGFIVLSALLLSVPAAVKCVLAVQTRGLLDVLRQSEREVERLAAILAGLERERVVVGRALRQIDAQRRQARARHELANDRLGHVKAAAPALRPAGP